MSKGVIGYKTWFICIYLVNAMNLFAQESVLQGSVQDSNSAIPLPDASVSLFSSVDSSMLSGTVSKKAGVFAINKIKTGTYYIIIKFTGYEKRIISNVEVQNGQTIDLGVILLRPVKAYLDAVTVTAQNAVQSNKLDKQVYKAEQFQSAKGGTAIDVLKNMPSVAVNIDGVITLRGSAGFTVLINGKATQADVTTVLGQLPANAIETIELITSPSAKYDPDGKAGIINIKLKEGYGQGLSVIANVQGGLPAVHDYGNKNKPLRFGADATIMYKSRIWETSVGISYLRNDAAGYREGNAYTLIDGVRADFPSSGERSFKRYNYTARASVSFTPDKQNIFSAGVYYGKRFQARTADLLYNNSREYLSTGEMFGSFTYYNTNLQTKEGDFALGNFDYTHTFNNKSALTFSTLYEYADLYGNIKNANLYYPKVNDTIQYTYNTNTNPLHAYRVSVNYLVKTKTGQLESGYQYRFDKQDGEFIYQTQIPGTNDFVIDPDFTSGVFVKNFIHSVYSQYSSKSNKLEYNAGLRYEYAVRKLSFSNDPKAQNLVLSNLFPSASLLYRFADQWKLKTAYSKRIQRTRNNELNPFPEREHSETLEQGDPDILPEYVNLAELGVIKDYKAGSFFVTAYYQHVKNPINRVNKVYSDTILNRLYTNAGKSRSWGVETALSIKAFRVLQLYIGGNFYNYKITGTLFNETVKVDNGRWSYSLNSNINLQLAKTVTAQFNVNYLSERATAQGEDGHFLSPNASLKKTFMKGKLAAMIQWQNIDMGLLNSNRQRITTSGADFYTTTNYIVETDVLMLSLSFNLNALNKKARLPSSEFGEKEF